ncbi:MAG: hypothetical protein CMI18_08845 [Opitutaceae bacterium]|mgnify:CR=1 FL=1|nr:hypothetical protein [Opitutaceae bacterium]|tara:strand:- start:1067 stop:1567 length:501 start_codon:yes stop_codon:yes gene_type:complete
MTNASTRRGFTLLEILLVLVIAGTVWMVFAVNMEGILDKDPMREMERSFTVAQVDGRMIAFENKQSLELAWDENASRFVLVGDSVISSYPIEGLEEQDLKLKATFYFQVPTFKGELFEKPEWYEVESVVFYSDASSAAYKVRLEVGAQNRELIIEPFTGFVSERSS